MAIVIEDSRGERKIIVELNEDEVALIKVVLGKCNTGGQVGKTRGLYNTFNNIKNLPNVHLIVNTNRDGISGLNITYNISRSGI